MYLPNPLYSGFTVVLYLLLVYILIVGFIQYSKLRKGEKLEHSLLSKSLIPVGVLALVVGIMGMVNSVQVAYETIAAVGDISPALAAGGISQSFPVLTLGLLSLAISLIFKYFNQ